MGYYTQYSLIVIDGDQDLIRQLREENENARYALDDEGNCQKECKWYDSDTDMKEFSKKHPEAMFQLYVIGEENGDIWRQWWQDGKCQTTKAELVYEEYDKNKMV